MRPHPIADEEREDLFARDLAEDRLAASQRTPRAELAAIDRTLSRTSMVDPVTRYTQACDEIATRLEEEAERLRHAAPDAPIPGMSDSTVLLAHAIDEHAQSARRLAGDANREIR